MSRNAVFAQWTEQLIRETCCNCGMPFAMASTFRDERLRDGAPLYCPAGHKQWYTRREDSEERLRRELSEALSSRNAARAQATHARDQYEAERRSKAAIKGHLTRIKRRIANGVCPCCQRSFANVRDHMASQHPDFLRDLAERERSVEA